MKCWQKEGELRVNVYKIQFKKTNLFVCANGCRDPHYGSVFAKKSTVSAQISRNPELYNVIEYELVDVAATSGDEWLKEVRKKK